MFRSWILVLVFVGGILSSLSAVHESDIEGFMENQINKVTELLKDTNQSKEMKSTSIYEILDSVFDYALISKLSLGKKQWNSLSSEEKKQFQEVFEVHLKRSYVDKLALYSNQKVVIKGIKKSKKSRIILLTDLVGSDEVYNLNYKFYKKSKEADWWIYDVDIVGVSLIKTYRAQFKDIFKDTIFKEVLAKLKDHK